MYTGRDLFLWNFVPENLCDLRLQGKIPSYRFIYQLGLKKKRNWELYLNNYIKISFWSAMALALFFSYVYSHDNFLLYELKTYTSFFEIHSSEEC